ncbi:MAG: hypothetical protein ACTSPR_07550, partial [Candidatus Thorarchaeota archaeon]
LILHEVYIRCLLCTPGKRDRETVGAECSIPALTPFQQFSCHQSILRILSPSDWRIAFAAHYYVQNSTTMRGIQRHAVYNNIQES